MDKDNHNHLSALEDIVSELQSLSKKQPVKDEDLLRVKELMRSLKQSGYTNKEISTLTAEKWGEPTIKLYTRGMNIKDSSLRDNATKVIAEMVSKGLTFEQVIVATSIKSEIDLAEGNVTLQDVLNIVEKVKKSNISDISEVIKLFNRLKTESKLSPLLFSQLSDLLNYKSELETNGLGIEHLKQILQMCKSYTSITKITPENAKGEDEETNIIQSQKAQGNKMITNILESVNTYGSIINLKNDVKNLELQKDQLYKKINLLNIEIKQIEDKKLEIGTPLKDYEDLCKAVIGFGNGIEYFNKLKDFCNLHGINNITELLEVLSIYGNLLDIKKEIKDLENKRKEAETNTREAESKYAHLMTVIGMCKKLLFDFKFSVSAIQDIYNLAQRYNEPFKVLQAISMYQNLQQIEEQTNDVARSKRELESQVKELNEQLSDIQGKIKAIKMSIDGILTSASSEINQAFKDSMSAITNTYQQQIGIIKKESEEYAIRAGQAKTLEEELNWARIIFSILKFPSEIKNISSDFALILLETVIRFCNAKGMNPTITIKESLISTGRYLSDSTEIPALVLIDAAKRALNKIIVVK